MTTMVRLITRHLRRFRRDQRGTVLIEMAIVAPMILLLSAGVFEFGNLIHDKLLMDAGLDDGARFAARCNSQIYTDANLTINCATVAKNLAERGNVAGTGTERVPGFNVTINTSTCYNTVDVNGVVLYLSTTSQVCVVTASGSLLYNGIGMLSLLNIGPITLNASHQERFIRF